MIPLEQLPPDPRPDLTLVRLVDLKLNPSLSYLRTVQDVFPGAPIVLLAEVVERADDGEPVFVRILP